MQDERTPPDDERARSPFRAFRPVLRCPVQAARIDADFPLVHRFAMLIDGLAIDAHNVLALVVVDQIQVLQRGDDVLLFDAGQFADFAGIGVTEVEFGGLVDVKCVRVSLDGDLWLLVVADRLLADEYLEYRLRPVGAIRQQAEIRQRFLR